VAAGVSPQSIEKQLAALARLLPNVERPLAQLSVIVEGKALLLRQGDGLIDPKGQWRLDFEAAERTDDASDAATGPATLALSERAVDSDAPATPAQMLEWASELEDDGQLASAVDMVRAALAAGGPTPEGCFQLAELLYRLDQPQAAIERYFVAIELDEDYVEARANLGCVLAEIGRLELAVAAFEGALAYHRDYPDVHYHLARTLEELDRKSEAARHWRDFIELCPDSPWADEARQRLAQ
jgi:tetratricopeptide (TPR) repeat protein